MKHKFLKILSKVILSITIAIILAVPLIANAHEFNPPRYWNDIYFHSGMNKHIVRIKINMNNVNNEVYNRKLQDAINDWEYNDNGFCHTEIVTVASNLMVYDSYPSTLNQTSFAVTSSSSSSANITVYPYGITGSTTTQACRKINRANIYANISRQQAAGFNEADIAKTWVHELGHVMGLNETNDGTQSVMRQGRGTEFGWDEFWKPQPHDILDISRYHRVTW